MVEDAETAPATARIGLETEWQMPALGGER